MTKALIVVESYFGNTRAIAEAVAAGMRAGATAVLTPGAASSYAALPQITEG